MQAQQAAALSAVGRAPQQGACLSGHSSQIGVYAAGELRYTLRADPQQREADPTNRW